jgi:transposase-like protein
MTTALGGRPSKFTPETRQKLIQAIRIGNHYDTACKYAGITYQSFRNWMIKGEQAQHADPSALTDGDLDYLAFYEAVQEAEANAEMVAVMRWREQMPSDWKAARDFLARRHPQRWGQRIEVTGGGIDDQILALLDDEGEMDLEAPDDGIIDAEVIEERPMLELPPGRPAPPAEGFPKASGE